MHTARQLTVPWKLVVLLNFITADELRSHTGEQMKNIGSVWHLRIMQVGVGESVMDGNDWTNRERMKSRSGLSILLLIYTYCPMIFQILE